MVQQTSINAYYELDLGVRQQEVYNAFQIMCNSCGDATDQEVKKYMNKPDANYVRPRRFELVNDFKLLGVSQKRQCRVTGKTCIAWKLVGRKK